MPNSKEHSKLTANAVALTDCRSVSTERLIREYCNYPDFYFSDPVGLAPYHFETDGVQFHYPRILPITIYTGSGPAATANSEGCMNLKMRTTFT